MFNRILIFLLLSSLVNATEPSREVASDVHREIASVSSLLKLSTKFIGSGDYYAATPIVKEYLNQLRGKTSKSFDKELENVIRAVGVKQFEVLSNSKLKKSNSPAVSYIIGKKYLKRNKYKTAIQYFDKVTRNSFYFPLALHGKAIIQTIRGDGSAASTTFDECIDSSGNRTNLYPIEKAILKDNADLCRLGQARVFYKNKNFVKSDLAYLDISKSSYIWPNILLEEAWNSYYLKNYNRTLGKLVTYKAPVFGFIFEPEIDVLNALAYFRLCLYKDSRKVANGFIKKYMTPARTLRKFLLSKGKDYSYFYNLSKLFRKGKKTRQKLLNNILAEIVKERSFKSLFHHFNDAINVLDKTNNQRSSRLRNLKLINIRDTITLQKRIIGSYVRGRIISEYAKLFNAFKDMSYIKLEILAQRKQRLYDDSKDSGKRGDIKYISRNKKQYFWDFNGEFWADELGDYVFALRSECFIK